MQDGCLTEQQWIVTRVDDAFPRKPPARVGNINIRDWPTQTIGFKPICRSATRSRRHRPDAKDPMNGARFRATRKRLPGSIFGGLLSKLVTYGERGSGSTVNTNSMK